MNPTKERIKRLEKHLKQENPILSGCVDSFRRLDRIACSLGLATADESFANQVSWWPVISVLGTFSAGKSTFLNQYVGQDLQRTGNQAVDDKFTVICYGTDAAGAALPGLALDSDPRFPFYQISRNIDQVAEGEGRRIDSYLQLKRCPAPLSLSFSFLLYSSLTSSLSSFSLANTLLLFSSLLLLQNSHLSLSFIFTTTA